MNDKPITKNVGEDKEHAMSNRKAFESWPLQKDRASEGPESREREEKG